MLNLAGSGGQMADGGRWGLAGGGGQAPELESGADLGLLPEWLTAPDGT